MTNSRRLAAVLFATTLALVAVAHADEAWDKYPKDENRTTGAPVGAPQGCCCIPKLHPTATEKLDCKPGLVEFDCKAECAQLKDGRDPSGCSWTKGDCPR
jgi:hypothetical protein